MSTRFVLVALFALGCRTDTIKFGDDTGPDGDTTGTTDSEDTSTHPDSGDDSGEVPDTGDDTGEDTGVPAEVDPDYTLCSTTVRAVIDTTGYDTVAQALAYAVDGDVVGVCSGAHYSSWGTIIEKTLTVRGPADADATLYASWDELFFVQRSDFTLENLQVWEAGSVSAGAVIQAYNSTVQLDHVTIYGTYGTHDGGAVFVSDGVLTVDHSTFTHNQSSGGAAIGVVDSDLTVRNSTFSDNQGAEGGAVRVQHTGGENHTARIEDTVFTGNNGRWGGALQFIASGGSSSPGTLVAELYSVEVTDNIGQWGGGICVNGSGRIELSSDANLHVKDNYASAEGGGLYMDAVGAVEATFASSFFTGNTAAAGGGIALVGTAPGQGEIICQQCTIEGNTAVERAGGVLVEGYSGGTDELNPLRLRLSGAHVRSNDATSGGGGVELGLSADLNDTGSDWGVSSGQRNAPNDLYDNRTGVATVY